MPTMDHRGIGVVLLAVALLAADPAPRGVQVEEPPGLGSGKPLVLSPKDAPPPGQCRLWFPDRKPAKQPPPGPCADLTRNTPPGAWVLHRDPDGKRLLRLR